MAVLANTFMPVVALSTMALVVPVRHVTIEALEDRSHLDRGQNIVSL